MSGWDTPSRPTWDPQDGPEDSTQAFPAPDGSGADDRWSQPGGPGSGWSGSGCERQPGLRPPRFRSLSDFSGVNPPGADLGGSDVSRADLGRADRRQPAFPPEPNGFPPDRNGFPPEPNGFAPDRNGFPPEPNGFPPDRNGFAPDQNGLPRRGPSSPPPSDFFTQAFDQQQPGTQAFEQRQPGATLAGRQVPGTDRYASGPQVSARDEPPWPGPARQESARQESARPDYGRAGEYGRTGEYGRQDFGRADFDRPGAPGGPGAPGQEFPRRDPGRADFSAYSTYSGQPDQAEQAPPAMNQGDAELAARMDPALQDFFAPTKPDPRYTSGRPSLAIQAPGLPGPALPGAAARPRSAGPRSAGPRRPAPWVVGASGAAVPPRRRTRTSAAAPPRGGPVG